mmetsp:Transcript_57918/g.137926  ORF Transcript_57918/g.137926 Transcript_57918/m.137926 type:complete len:273 (+) Transcript_57918:1-819(+)
MVDWWSQWMMCIPCGFMLACVVFKANCQPGYPCVDGNTMIVGCVAAFFGHVLLHTLAFKFLVPKFGLAGASEGADANTYQDCSRRIPCSWFTTNPVYCLRSQYIYQHQPPALFCIPGKEHLLEVNEDIGLYFNDCAAKEEDYDAPHVDVEKVKENLKELKGKATQQFEELKGQASANLEELKGKATGHLEELNKQVSGKFGDLQGQMSAMQGTMQGTMQGMQGSMSAMGQLTSNWSMFGKGSQETDKEKEDKEEDKEDNGEQEPSTGSADKQ